MAIENELRAVSEYGAGWVMWLLVLLSVLVVAIAIERAIVLWFGAFHALDQVSTALMREIGEALTATGVRLFVALPAVVRFNIYQRRIVARIAQAEALGRELLSYVKDEQRTLLISEAA